MQIVSKQFARNVKSGFLVKKKEKTITNLLSAELAQRGVKVKTLT